MIRRVTLCALVALAAGCSSRGRPPEPPTAARPPDEPAPSIDLVLQVTEDAARVLDHAETSRRPTDLRPPTLTPEVASNFPLGTREIVTSFHDRHGRGLVAYGWPARPPEFHPDGTLPDRPGGEGHAAPVVQGTTALAPQIDDRLMTLPLPRAAAYVAFLRTEVVARGGATPGSDREVSHEPVTVRVTPLGVYWLGRQPPPWPFHPTLGLAPPLTGLPVPPAPSHRLRRQIGTRTSDPECGSGHIDKLSSPWLKGSPIDLFDIAVVGDGYQQAELGKFDASAELLITGLLGLKRGASGHLVADPGAGVAPYSTLRDKINVHVVRVASNDSGIDACPANAPPAATYFGTFGQPQNPGFLDSPCLVWATNAAKAAMEAAGTNNPGLPELIVLLANCDPPYGGRAKFLARWALLPAFPASNTSWGVPRLVGVGAHESAHVVVGVADELVRCVEWNKLPVHPCNVALQADLDAMQTPAAKKPIWWWTLTLPEERAAGTFKAIHREGDAFEDAAHTLPKIAAPGSNRMLGAYWGSLYGDCPGAPPVCPQCDPYEQPEGRKYYRPMATCRMRFWEDPSFCRVCTHELTHAIDNATWGKSPECYP